MRRRLGPLFLAASLVAAAPPVPSGPQPKSDQPGQPGMIRELDEQGYRVRLDLRDQVLRVAIPEDRSSGKGGATEAPILPTLQGSSDGFVSASMLAQKAKQFDDGLYAAVELAAQKGAGRLGGKAAMLQAVARALASTGAGQPGTGTAPSILLAACQLGEVPVRVPEAIEPRVRSFVLDFLADPLRSKPIGFYTWSDALADIFRQDRALCEGDVRGQFAARRAIDQPFEGPRPARPARPARRRPHLGPGRRPRLPPAVAIP